MNQEDAEEYTQALGQVVSGSWRQIALAERLGVPEALGMATSDWVEQRLGGYVRMSIPERREAAAELAAEGLSQREIAGVLGVSQPTVNADLRDQDRSEDPQVASEAEVEEPESDLPDQDLSDFPPSSGPDAVKEEVPADVPSPAPASTVLDNKQRAERDREEIERERRQRHSRSFAESIAALWSLLDPDPIAFAKNTWQPEANPHRTTPGAKDAFTSHGLGLLADRLADLAEHLEQTGDSL